MKNQEVFQRLSDEKERMRGSLPLNLQFFASNNSDDNNNDDDNDDAADEDDDEDEDEKKEKTFTQSQVTAMLAREKKEGRRSMLRSLGFSSVTEAKNTMSALQKLLNGNNNVDTDSNVNDNNDDNNDDEAVRTALERAEVAESKLACITAGVNKESIDDVLAIAKFKVSDDKDLATVLTEMSKEAKYASFFDEEQGDKGTGNDPGHVKKKDSQTAGSYGARLASSTIQQKEKKKSSYF